MNVHKQKLYLLEQRRDSFEIWLASIRINTEGNSWIMKMGLVPPNTGSEIQSF